MRACIPQMIKGFWEYPKDCVNLQTGKSILHQFGGLHNPWDTPYPFSSTYMSVHYKKLFFCLDN